MTLIKTTMGNKHVTDMDDAGGEEVKTIPVNTRNITKKYQASLFLFGVLPSLYTGVGLFYRGMPNEVCLGIEMGTIVMGAFAMFFNEYMLKY